MLETLGPGYFVAELVAGGASLGVVTADHHHDGGGARSGGNAGDRSVDSTLGTSHLAAALPDTGEARPIHRRDHARVAGRRIVSKDRRRTEVEEVSALCGQRYSEKDRNRNEESQVEASSEVSVSA